MFDKRSREDEWNRERAQLEMENAQLKMQLAKESVSVGVKKGSSARNPENDELTKLKKTLHAKGFFSYIKQQTYAVKFYRCLGIFYYR